MKKKKNPWLARAEGGVRKSVTGTQLGVCSDERNLFAAEGI